MDASVSRWHTLGASLAVMLCAGTGYAWGIYSEDLKLDGMAIIGTMGVYVPIAGFFYDAFGPRLTLIVAALLNFAGSGLVWAAASKYVVHSFAAVSAFNFINGHAAGYYDAGALATSLHNFPRHRGLVVGLLKSFYGLSASILTQIYVAFMAPNPKPFLLFLACLGGVVVLAIPFVVRQPTEVVEPDAAVRARFKRAYRLVTALALALLAVSIARAAVDFSQAASVIVCFVALAFTLAIWGSTGSGAPLPRVTDSDPEEPLLLSVQHESQGNKKKRDLKPIEMVQTLDFWLMYFVLFAGMGAGLMLTSNLAQIVDAQHGDSTARAVAVSLVSVANCGGRLLAGYVSDSMPHVRRPFFLVVAVGTMAAAQLLLAFSSLDMLPASVFIAAAAYGSFWTLNPACTSEMFGLTHFASNYQLLTLAPTAGSIVYALVLASHFYEAEEDSGSNDCYGSGCFRPTFLICSASCALATGAAVLLWRRSG